MGDLDTGFRLQGWTVHPQQNRLTGPAGDVHLTPRCMDILVLLAEHAGQVVDRDEFSERIWHPAVVTDDALTRHVSSLRQTLGDLADQPRFIETIPKRGYRLVADVQPLPDTPDSAAVKKPHASSADNDQPGTKSPPLTRALILTALALGLGVVALFISIDRQPGQETPSSIAVLPFEAFGTDDNSPLIDGLHHDLLTRLSHIDGLSVISRTSVKRYRDTILPIADVAAELGVAWIVEGAVQQVGNEIQLNAQLIDEARTEEGLEQALVFFRQAVEQDDKYALAWVGIADALALLHDYGYRTAEDVLPEAERAIEQWHYWSALAMNHYHPLIEPIRSDPRFESIMINLRQHYGLAADGSLP